jgi:hypothetical protein
MKKASAKILLEALIAILCLLLGAFVGVFLDSSGYLGPPVEHTGAAKVLIPLSILVIIAWAIVKICKQNKEGKDE